MNDKPIHDPRCVCYHTAKAHPEGGGCEAVANPTPVHPNRNTPCRCLGYRPAQTWRVKPGSLFGCWLVMDPDGVLVAVANDQPWASRIAQALATASEAAARVERLERAAFGRHPALRAPMAQRYARPEAEIAAEVDPMVRGLRNVVAARLGAQRVHEAERDLAAERRRSAAAREAYRQQVAEQSRRHIGGVLEVVDAGVCTCALTESSMRHCAVHGENAPES